MHHVTGRNARPTHLPIAGACTSHAYSPSHSPPRTLSLSAARPARTSTISTSASSGLRSAVSKETILISSRSMSDMASFDDSLSDEPVDVAPVEGAMSNDASSLQAAVYGEISSQQKL